MELDWTSNTTTGDELRIPLQSTADPVWMETFERIASLQQSETRGQTWDGVQLEVDGKTVVVFGVEPGTRSHDIRRYLTEMVETVDREAEATRQREARQAAQDEQRAQSGAEEMQRLSDELRRES